MHQKLTVSRKVASHLALHQPKKAWKTYSLQYIYMYWLGFAKIVTLFWGCCCMNHWQFRDVSQLVNINFHRILRGFTPRWDATPGRGGCTFLSATLHCLFNMMTLFKSKPSLPGFYSKGIFSQNTRKSKKSLQQQKRVMWILLPLNFSTCLWDESHNQILSDESLWDLVSWWLAHGTGTRIHGPGASACCSSSTASRECATRTGCRCVRETQEFTTRWIPRSKPGSLGVWEISWITNWRVANWNQGWHSHQRVVRIFLPHQ